MLRRAMHSIEDPYAGVRRRVAEGTVADPAEVLAEAGHDALRDAVNRLVDVGRGISKDSEPRKS